MTQVQDPAERGCRSISIGCGIVLLAFILCFGAGALWFVINATEKRVEAMRYDLGQVLDRSDLTDAQEQEIRDELERLIDEYEAGEMDYHTFFERSNLLRARILTLNQD